MRRHPSSKDDLELGHHIVYYTFLPMVVLVFGTIVLSFPAWFFGFVSSDTAFYVPWAAVFVACVYIVFLGHYVMPTETYRHVRNGDFDE